MANPKKVKVRILKPVAGKYKLSASVGKTISVEAKQAKEMIESNYAVEVATKTAPPANPPK